MKQKKLLALLLVLVMTISVLAGCGASSSYKDAVVEEAAPMEPMKDMAAGGVMMQSNGMGSTTQEMPTGQKLIRRVNIDAETEDLDALLVQLQAQISASNGYIERQDLYNGSSYSSYRHRNANLTIRIPADKLDGFVVQLKDASNVVNYSESQEDVTLTYVSTESRIKALETEQERLLELLSQAENMSDLLEIEARLTDVRYELESVTSQLLVLANKVDYATINLYISQVKEYTEVDEQTVWQRISNGFKENLKDIGEGAVDFFVWLVTYSPQLVLSAVVIAGGSVLLRRVKAKKCNCRKGKKTAEPEEKSE